METSEYTVAVAFTDIDGSPRSVGSKVQLPLWRAQALHKAGFIAGPIYQQKPGEPWQAVHGSARRVTSREENIAGLESAILLANELRALINAHYADAADHTTAIDADHVVVAPQAGSLAALIILVSELLTSYSAHDDDAELGALWVYHAAQEAGDHSLASVAAPVNLQECITRLNDLQTKYDAHDADNTCHGVGSNHQTVAAAAAYGAVVRVPIRGAKPKDLVNWSILEDGTGTVEGRRATAGFGFVDFEFDADPQNDCVISYQVSRKL